MTEKVDPPKIDNSQPPHGATGGENKDSPSPRLPATPGEDKPPVAVREPSRKIIDAIRNNPPGFLYALIVIFVNAFGVILYFLLYRGMIKDFVDLIYLFVKSLSYLIVIADLSALIWWITSIIYRNRSKKDHEDSIDRQVLYGSTKLNVFNDDQRAFIRFYSTFGGRKLGALKRVESITISLLEETDNFRQIGKEAIMHRLHNYQSSGVYRKSRDGLYIEAVEGLDAFKIYAMQVAYEEKIRNGRKGNIDLSLDIRPVRKGSNKMWWDHPYDKVLQNIALLTTAKSASLIISQLKIAYDKDKKKPVGVLQLAYKIAISGVMVDYKVLRDLLETIRED